MVILTATPQIFIMVENETSGYFEVIKSLNFCFPSCLQSAAVVQLGHIFTSYLFAVLSRYRTATRVVAIGLFWQISPKKNYYYYSSHCAVQCTYFSSLCSIYFSFLFFSFFSIQKLISFVQIMTIAQNITV